MRRFTRHPALITSGDSLSFVTEDSKFGNRQGLQDTIGHNWQPSQ
jgi:hypothetical protein